MQSALADKIGVSRQRMVDFLHGRKHPSLEQGLALLRVMRPRRKSRDGDNPAIIASARAENRLAECLPFVRRERSLSQWRAHLRGQKRLERSMRRERRSCSAL
jgi:DNA-binding XRE family transcriptional regulator